MKKLFTLFTAMFLAVSVLAPSASALTLSDVELLIALGIIPQEKAEAARAAIGATGSTGNSSAYCGPFTRSLTIGATGADVVLLQDALITSGDLVIPAGVSKGYFGPLTRSALASFQAKNAIAPAVGYFGPITMAKFTTKCSQTPSNNSNNSNSSNTSSDALKGGEASLEDFKMKDGDDNDVQEGGSAEVAEIEFDVEDGDIKIERLDLTFEFAGTTGENEPWDAFDTITLLANGKKLASKDVSDEDDWLDDNDPFVFRFSGLNYVVREGDKAKITVEVEAQKGVDDADTSGANDWTIYVDTDDIRALDAAGIDQYVGDSGESVTFGIEEKGANDELNVRSSKDDPDASVLVVESTKRSSWYTLFAFELDADDSDNDIEIDQLPVIFESSTGVTAVINDLEVVIDGEAFGDYTWLTTSADGITGTASTTRVTLFDIDKDFTLDAGDKVEVEVRARFNSLANYVAGTTIQARVDSDSAVDSSPDGASDYTDITGEGADDIIADGSATGDTHTLRDTGINVVSKNANQTSSRKAVIQDGDNNDYAEFFLELDIEALEDTAYLSEIVTTSFEYSILDSSGNVVASTTYNTGSTTVAVDTSAQSDGAYYRIDKGDTEMFTLRVSFVPGTSGSYKLRLDAVNFNDTKASPDTVFVASPESSFRTATVAIIN